MPGRLGALQTLATACARVRAGARGTIAAALAERFDQSSESPLTSPAGPALRGSFEGGGGRPLWGVATDPGGCAAPPDIGVGASPAEGTAEGRVVVDGSVLFLG